MAERMGMALGPPLLGAALIVVCALGYRNLSDRRIAYVVPLFLIMSGYILVQFRPLRVDHHGWQIFLAMLVMAQALRPASWRARSEEHTSELQSLMRISYAVFCLKKKTDRT